MSKPTFIPAIVLKPGLDLIKEDAEARDQFSELMNVDFNEFYNTSEHTNLTTFQAISIMGSIGYAEAGFLIGLRIPMGALGMLDYLLPSCANLGEAIICLIRYFPTLGTNLPAPNLTRPVRGQICLSYQSIDSKKRDVLINHESLVAAYMSVIDRLSRGESKPCKLEVLGESISDSGQKLLDDFGITNVSYGKQFAVFYDERILKIPLPFANTKLANILKNELEEKLVNSAQAETMVDRIIRVMKEAKTFNDISQTAVADALYTSESSLKRALANEKTSFSNIVTSYKRAMAMREIIQSTDKIDSIAMELGYSERASFDRAFKAWFNLSPQQVRKMTSLLGLDTEQIHEQDVFNIPISSKICQRILTMLEEESYTFTSLAELVSKDPVLSGKIVGIANSAYYGGREVSNVQGAVQVLGVDTVQNLALSYMVSREMDVTSCKEFDVLSYWILALSYAEAAKKFMDVPAVRDERDGKYLMLGGLLNNIGTYAIAHLQPEHTSKFLELIQNTRAEYDQKHKTKLQVKLYSFSYYKVGSLLLKHWGLPLGVCELIAQLESVFVENAQPSVTSVLLAYLITYMNDVVLLSDDSEFQEEWVHQLSDLLTLEVSDVKMRLVSITNKIDDLKNVARQLAV